MWCSILKIILDSFLSEKHSEVKLNFKRQVFLLENILEMIPIHRLKYRKVGKSIYQNTDDDRLSSVTKIKEIFILFVSMVCIFLIFLWLLPITCKIKLKINTQISRDVFNTSETDKKTITQRTGWVEANKKYKGQETAKLEKLPKMSWSPEAEGESWSFEPVEKVKPLKH